MKQKSQRYSVYFLLAFLPAVLFLLWLLFMKLTGTAVSTAPVVSDELFWYHQITAMVDSDMPLGYFGYNGTHAPHGTFGPWGIAILIPYALWGKIFGFDLYSMCIANVTMLGLALFFFALLARVKKKDLPYLLAGYCTLLLNIFYSVSSMAEPLRWGLGIVLAGCMVRIYRGCGKFFRYVFMPLFLLYCAQAYLLLTLFVPVYLMLVLPVKKLWLRLGISGIITAVLAVIMRKVLFLVVSPLYVSSGETLSLGELIQNKISSAWLVLKNFTPAGLWENRTTSYGFVSLFLLTFLVFLFLTLFLALRTLKGERLQNASPKDSQKPVSQNLPLYLLAFYLLAGALGGYCLVYHNPSLWTVCRGLNTAFASAVLLLALCRSKKLTLLCVLLSLIALPSFYKMSVNNLERRVFTKEQEQLYQTAKEDFQEIFDISPENSRWDNTIAQYGLRNPGTQTALTLAMPRNAGYNSMLNTNLVSEAKYALVFHSDKKKYPGIIENLKANGYEISYQHKTLTILTRADASEATMQEGSQTPSR